jgi:hypothetical protein
MSKLTLVSNHTFNEKESPLHPDVLDLPSLEFKNLGLRTPGRILWGLQAIGWFMLGATLIIYSQGAKYGYWLSATYTGSRSNVDTASTFGVIFVLVSSFVLYVLTVITLEKEPNRVGETVYHKRDINPSTGEANILEDSCTVESDEGKYVWIRHRRTKTLERAEKSKVILVDDTLPDWGGCDY